MSGRRSRRSSSPRRWLFPLAFVLLLAAISGLLYWDASLPGPSTHQDAAAQAPPTTTRTLTSEINPRTITEGDATITLETGAEVRITREGDKPAREIELRRGSITVRVRPVPGGQFVVRTVNATVGVRGTTFRVSVIGFFITRVVVEEGKVSVRGQTGDEILLGAGESGQVLGADSARPGTDAGASSADSEYPTWNAETIRRIAELSEALERSEREARGTMPATSGADLSPEVTTTSRNRLTGTGDWSAENGLSGQITLVIEPISGSFMGTFSGSREGATPLSVRGNAQGALVGDANNGSLTGTFTAEAEPAGAGARLPPISGEATGILRNHLVTGTLNAGAWRGNYEVRLK